MRRCGWSCEGVNMLWIWWWRGWRHQQSLVGMTQLLQIMLYRKKIPTENCFSFPQIIANQKNLFLSCSWPPCQAHDIWVLSDSVLCTLEHTQCLFPIVSCTWRWEVWYISLRWQSLNDTHVFQLWEWVLQYIRESIPEVGSQKSCFQFVCTWGIQFFLHWTETLIAKKGKCRRQQFLGEGGAFFQLYVNLNYDTSS
jgi:hypothetical protein